MSAIERSQSIGEDWRPQEREAVLLAPYAMHSAQSRGRRYPEPPHPYRSPFQRDRDRITHSSAYRRLSSKTQVFTGELGDYHRTRLTHTLEVSSVSRTLGRALALNEDLVEALALVHDLGHPPFGHAGEDTLDECLRGEGGFSHNAHALRIVEHLETRYHGFSGLNLSLEVLEGQSARIKKSLEPLGDGAPATGDRPAGLAPLLEAQVVEAADSVTYNTHDADDALELSLLGLEEMFTTGLWAEARRRVEGRFQALDASELRRAVLHELIDWQVGDLLSETTGRIQSAGIRSVDQVRTSGPLVVPTEEIRELNGELQQFLHDRVYRHAAVLRHRQRAQGFLREMFDYYVARPGELPGSFRARIEHVGLPQSVVDYLAGMTDRYAEREYHRIAGAHAG